MAAHAFGPSQGGAVRPTISPLLVDLYEVRMAKNGRPYTFLQFIHYYGADDWFAKWQECETKQRAEPPKITDCELLQLRLIQGVEFTKISFPFRPGPCANQ